MSIPQVASPADYRLDRVPIHFLLRGESECTSEMVRRQFSIFGAVEENPGHGHSRINTDQGSYQRYPAKPRGGRGFGLGERAKGKIWESGETDCPQRVHRKCRKAVASCQLPVASSQLEVAGCAENHASRRCSNSRGAALMAPQCWGLPRGLCSDCGLGYGGSEVGVRDSVRLRSGQAFDLVAASLCEAATTLRMTIQFSSGSYFPAEALPTC